MDRVLDCQIYRRFGVEIELNTLSGLVRRLDEDDGEIPEGADYVASLIRKATKLPVEIHGWHHTHNNNHWLVKPDSSCGMEVCSPVLKGWKGLKSVLKVIQTFGGSRIAADRRCSLHVHVNIGDLTIEQLASVIAYYIKCEHIFYDAMPSHRKSNRYCQCLGMTDLFEHNFPMVPEEIVSAVSGVKYYSVNAYHFVKGGGFAPSHSRRKTIEFRIADSAACLCPFYAKNWIRLLLHFVEVSKNLPLPSPYRPNDPWSGLLWLGPKDVFKILRFDEPLSPGLEQVRRWFMGSIFVNGYDSHLPGMWSNEGRESSRREFLEFYESPQCEQVSESSEEMLFGKKYIL